VSWLFKLELIPLPSPDTDALIWHFRLDEQADENLLSPNERQRADRLLIPQKRQHFIAARVGLRLILSQQTSIPPQDLIFAYQPQGKPYLVGMESVYFNLSHADDLAVVAVADRPVGIDVERERPLSSMAQMMEIAFSPAEQAAVDHLPSDSQTRAFYRTWTRKEALMKGHGEGFKLAHTFTLPLADLSPTIHLDGWTIHDLQTPSGFVAALALRDTMP
jgi:4'-phosphopantetheinyl transferase